ncbi:hypothetical protein Tco_0787754 [Tanacetum coccineum]
MSALRRSSNENRGLHTPQAYAEASLARKPDEPPIAEALSLFYEFTSPHSAQALGTYFEARSTGLHGS